MRNYQQNFFRDEKKYLITKEQQNQLLQYIGNQLEMDQYGKYRICNLYFETLEYDLIRQSISKPLYKEKFRLRSYGTPEADSNVHLEIKKKFKGIVYKRRISLPYEEAMKYCANGEYIGEKQQIFKEIAWFFQRYALHPTVYLSYNRMAMKGIHNPELRITFDSDLLWRTDCLDLQMGDFGHRKLDTDQLIMEIKTNGSMPLWLSHALSELKIYPCSFSKYGRIYQDDIMKRERKGDE